MTPHASVDAVRAALDRAPRDLLRDPQGQPPVKWAAVCALLTPGARGLRMWFMRRATVPGDPWSGQLSFPGGRREAQDATLHDTAVRETEEEFGLRLPDLCPEGVLGRLDDLRTRPVRDLAVRPFVWTVASLDALRPNREVASVHGVDLADLLAGVGRGTFNYTAHGGSFTLPCVTVDGHRLWGLTLQMVDDLLHRLDGRGHGVERPTA